MHLWIVPAAIEGAWLGEGGAFRLSIKQRYQRFEGRLMRGGRTVKLGGDITGARIRFTIPGRGGRHERFTGTVNGGRMTGEVRGEDGALFTRWSATRVP